MKKLNVQSLPFSRAAALSLMIVFAVGAAVVPLVDADRYQNQINELQSENNEAQGEVYDLVAEAEDLQGTIAVLQKRIDGIQRKISANEAKNAELEKQIELAEEELAKQKHLLGENIKAMYLEGDITTLEMLASSKDLSEFIDKQQYRSAVKDKIKSTLDEVNALKLQLDTQKAEVEQLLKEQKVLHKQVATQKAEQNRLLNLNQSQQYAFNQQIQANKAKITELRRLQAIENQRFTAGTGVACGGGYPGDAPGPWGRWGCNYPLDYSVDPWGMYNRECVSYTAFKVNQDYRLGKKKRDMPYWGGYGNANQWDDNARAMGIPVDRNPRAGDVAVSNSGYYGHVMYVEHVYEDGRILISQYNGSWQGKYSEAVIWPGDLWFIHFP